MKRKNVTKTVDRIFLGGWNITGVCLTGLINLSNIIKKIFPRII